MAVTVWLVWDLGLHNSLLCVRACRVAAESGPSIQAALATYGANLKQQARTLLGLGPPLSSGFWWSFARLALSILRPEHGTTATVT